MSLIGKNIGNYQIKAKLGEGGMGAVYLGEHPLIGKRVAVKVLLEELASKEDIVNRFFNEAKAVNDIGHQNIVDIVDFGKAKIDDGSEMVYFIMEFLDGESLQGRLKRAGLSFKETLHIMKQCCSALSASHAKGIVHRDLKPDNIYLCDRGGDKNFVKILDFGIAKLTGDGPAGSQKTRTGIVIGTPAYMSPEQCEGKGQIDARSDVYSLGVVMYEMLTGRVPFPGDGFGEILVAHLTRQPDRPSQVNPDIKPELEAIVTHALEKDKNRRYQSMKEFEEAVLNPAAHLATYSPLPGYTPDASLQTSDSMQTMLADGPPRITGMQAAVQRPTTLSGAAAEVGAEAPRRSAGPMIGAALAVLVTGGAIGGYFLTKGGNKPTTPEASTVGTTTTPEKSKTPETPKAEKITIKLTSEPAGAKVYRADKGSDPVGTTPYSMDLDKSTDDIQVQIKLDGYQTMTKSIKLDMNKEIPLTLVKVPDATPVPVKQDKPKIEKKVSSGDKPPVEKKKKSESSSGDDMKLLQPKF